MTHHPSFGSILKWDPAGGTDYSAVGQVQDISGPTLTRGDVDVSDHDSADGYREYLPGLADGGNVTFTIGFDPEDADHVQGVGTGLIGDLEQSGCTLPTWEYTLATCAGTAIWTWAAYVNSFTQNSPVEGQHTADVGLKISGKPTLSVT